MRSAAGSVNILFQDLFASLVSIIAGWRRCLRVSRLLCGVLLEASTSHFKIFPLPSFPSLPVGIDVSESAAHYRGLSENVNASFREVSVSAPASVSCHFWRWRLRGGRIMGGKKTFGKGLFEIFLWCVPRRRRHGVFVYRWEHFQCVLVLQQTCHLALLVGHAIERRMF